MPRKEVFKVSEEEHNKYRRKHGVPEITGASALHKEAQEWAEYLAKNDQFFHSTGRQKHMENLAGAHGETEEDAVRHAFKMWYGEISSFDFNYGGFSMQTGHFTAMVWSTLRTTGIGICYNPRKRWWVVANKFGEVVNMQGEFRQKVPRPLSAAQFEKNEAERQRKLEEAMKKATVSEPKKEAEKKKIPEGNVVEDKGQLSWVAKSNGESHEGGVIGGKDSGEDMFVIRVKHEEAVLPGKLVAGSKVGVSTWGALEVKKADYEILTASPADSVKWIRGLVDVDCNAVPGGTDPTGEVYFIGRVSYNGALTVGKVYRGHCFIPYGGRERGFGDYEILVRC